MLKGGTVIPAERDAFTVIRSLPHGHVAAAVGIARKIGLEGILGPDGNRCRDLVLAMLIGRILDRIIHNAHRIELHGETLRKPRAGG